MTSLLVRYYSAKILSRILIATVRSRGFWLSLIKECDD